MSIPKEILEEIQTGVKNKKFRMNSAHLYGMRDIFLEYFELPKNLMTSFHLDHGINLPEPNKKPESYSYENNAAIFVTNEEMAGLYRSLTDKPVHAVGALFPRYREMHKIEPKAERKGTVAFPIHSIFGVDIKDGWRQYAEDLLNLPEEFHPIKICVYWLDVERGRHKVFEEMDLEVMTAGYFTSQKFVQRFYDILSNAKYATSNEFGSYLPYAIEMGIPFFMYGKRVELENSKPDTIQKFPAGKFEFTEEFGFKWYDYVQQLYRFPEDGEVKITPEQRAFTERLLGFDQSIDKEAVRKAVYRSQIPHLPKYTKDLIHKSIWDVIHLLPTSVEQQAYRYIKPYYKVQQ